MIRFSLHCRCEPEDEKTVMHSLCNRQDIMLNFVIKQDNQCDRAKTNININNMQFVFIMYYV